MQKKNYICPKCGSKNWKFPNPLKGTDSMINTPGMVNNLHECSDCGYIGIFFVQDNVDEENGFVKKKKVRMKNKHLE